MSAINSQFAPTLIPKSALGVAGGVAQLGSDGLLLAAQRPAAVSGPLVIKGAIDLSTALPSSPSNGDFYTVSKAGNGGGVFPNIVPINSSIYYVSANSTWYESPDYTSTDTLAEGSTNQYFTAARAQAAAVINSLTASTTQAPSTTAVNNGISTAVAGVVQNSLTASTTLAPSVSAVNTGLATKAGAFTRFKERFVLSSTDISNGYIYPSHAMLPFSITAGVVGGGLMEEQTTTGTGDYTVGAYGSGQTPIKFTWINDFASGGACALVAGNIIFLHYSY